MCSGDICKSNSWYSHLNKQKRKSVNQYRVICLQHNFLITLKDQIVKFCITRDTGYICCFSKWVFTASPAYAYSYTRTRTRLPPHTQMWKRIVFLTSYCHWKLVSIPYARNCHYFGKGKISVNWIQGAPNPLRIQH